MKGAGYMSWALQRLNQRLSLVVFILQPQVKNPSHASESHWEGNGPAKVQKGVEFVWLRI